MRGSWRSARTTPNGLSSAKECCRGKVAVRQYMATTYIEPPEFTTTQTIAEGDFLTVLGDITLKDENGCVVQHSYCDVWGIRGGKIAELKAFVIKTQTSP